MALAKPPAWDIVEQDERFKALTPELKLQTLDNWSAAARKYGLESGSFNDPVQRKAYTDWVDAKRVEYSNAARKAAPGYKAYQEAEGWDAVKAFATNPIEVTSNIVAEGMAGSLLSLALVGVALWVLFLRSRKTGRRCSDPSCACQCFAVPPESSRHTR